MTAGCKHEGEVWTWDNFLLKPATRELSREGIQVTLGSRSFDVLVTLVRRHGGLVSKDELIRTLWTEDWVIEENLNLRILALRRLMGAQSIVSVAGQGYRFTAKVTKGGTRSDKTGSNLVSDDQQSPYRIFVSYRRSDTEHAVGRLVEDLSKYFSAETIYHDLNSVKLGIDYPKSIRRALRQCSAALVVIGPNWLNAVDQQGRRRIDQAEDWVRQEVAASLQAENVHVIPLLVGDAEMPKTDQLPKQLQKLAHRQAGTLTSRHWKSDVANLALLLGSLPGLHVPPPNAA